MSARKFTVPEKLIINEMMERLYALSGKRPGYITVDWADQWDLGDGSTGTSDISIDTNLYVDGTFGNDINDGLDPSTSFRTIMKAINSLPLFIGVRVRIFVAAGTYNEQVRVDKILASSINASLHLIGTMALFTTTSGPNTGVVQSQTGRIITPTVAPAWTVNDFRGWFVRLTSGTWSGFVFPIAANTTGTFEISSNIQLAAGVTYEIVRPSTIINGGATSSDVAIWSGANGPRALSAVTAFGANPLATGFVVANFELQGYRSVRVHEEIKLYGVRCSPSGDVGVSHVGGMLQMSRCVVMPTIASTGSGIASTGADLMRLEGCFVRGNLIDFSTGLFVDGVGQINPGATEGCIFENWYAGMRLQPGSRNPATAGVICRANRDGCVVSGPAALTFSGSSEFTNNSQYGIRMADNVSSGEPSPFVAIEALVSGNGVAGVYVGSRGYLFLGNPCTFVNNGHGIYINGAHNSIVVLNGCSITGSAGFGIGCIFAVGAKEAAFNNIRVGTTVTMSGNVSGDFTIDGGTTPISIAELRAVTGPPADQMVNLNYFNRLYEA